MKSLTTTLTTITIVTVLLWISGKDLSHIKSNPLLATSQITALLGIVFMGFTLTMSSRIKFIEKFIGGMDKMMKAHHLIGMVSFLLIIHHPLLLVVKSIALNSVALTYLVPGSDTSYNLGIFSLYILLLSLISILFLKLPYNIFKNTHQFLGLSFLLAGAHALTIGSDIGNNLPLKVWVAAWIILGLFGSIYIIFLYKYLGPKYNFFVTSIKRIGDVIHIDLKVLDKDFYYEPGQFCFISFHQSDISNESHPFTLSSSESDGKQIRVSAKILGDYTLTLTHLKKDARATVFGPYGHFGKGVQKSDRQIWIAGGIGITPFVSMIVEAVKNPAMKILLIYVVRENENDLFLEEIPQSIKAAEHILFVPWNTKNQSRPTASKILDIAPDLSDAEIFMCGPNTMMDNLRKQFSDLSISPQRIHTESFSMI